MNQAFYHVPNWSDYELLDSGGFEKLERFGAYVLRRPEPQAIWAKQWTEKDWAARTDAHFIRQQTARSNKEDAGSWQLKPKMAQQWWVAYSNAEGMKIRLRLGLTAFKHLGIFPEQANNWDFIYRRVKSLEGAEPPKVLNLFAYTGGASLAARAAGADVTHVDAVKPVITWAKENMEGSGLQNIRWVVEDALKFCQREAKRGRQYQGLILDPPAYGRGPEGEKWVLDEHLPLLLGACGQLLAPKGFLVLNLYSIGFSALILENLGKTYFKLPADYEVGEFFLQDGFQKKLPLGTFLRF
jgi:23S rRNA (cytosine1962-C5)-methyltransferase